MAAARRIPQDLGLSPGQAFGRENRLIKNSLWYDQNAERVGTGDIAHGQPEKIAENLESGEMLAILPSHVGGNSWRPSAIDRFFKRTEDEPGLNFVARNFALFIVPRCVYIQGFDGSHANHVTYGDRPTLSPKAAKNIMLSVQRLSSNS